MSDLSPNTLVVSFILGFVGLGLFMYGKRTTRVPYLLAGVLFMVYPYFTPSVTVTLGVGALIGAATWWMVRQGW